jgi:hypothetical protein
MTRAKRVFVPMVALLVTAIVFTLSGRAEEGFWPYNSIPKAAIKAKYGFDVTDAWLNHLQLATVRFAGGTGSIVSPNGLVLTNHHIALGSLQQLSTADKDLVKNGFVAQSMAEELKVPGMQLSVLQTIQDVTPQVVGVVKPDMDPTAATMARQAAITQLQSGAAPGTSKQVVPLYAGAVYNLYTYKVYSDVRLVFGAEYQAGFYGGDPDNFTFPRYCLDVGMFRVYENDKPASTPEYLKWSPAGSKDGELVFTTGHPGATQRLNTVAHLKWRRDLALPFAIAVNESREASLQKWMALSPENARTSKSDLFGIQNSLKSWRGQLKGLQDPAVMSVKEAAEARLISELAKNNAKNVELGDAWGLIARSIQVAREVDAERNFIVLGAGLNSTLFAQARTLVRTGLAGSGRAGGGGPPSAAPVPPVNMQREKINLTDSLNFMVKHLGADHAITKRILLGKAVDARVTELLSTRITDPEIRTLLLAGGKATIDAATDPMIVLARSLEPDVQPIVDRYAKEVTAMQNAAYPKIGQAVFVVDGPKAYPDATGTLRLSYGTVKSYLENGKTVAPYTVMGGLFERSDQNQNKEPFDLAPRFVEAKNTLDPKTPFNFVSTNDIVGGNSGSPVVNKKGEVVGLIFDGNIQSLPGYFIYQQEINRAVSVDSRAIVETLKKVYKATAIVEELTGPKR